MTDPVVLPWVMAGLSDVGRHRSRNEDSFGGNAAQGFALVCDGLGGHAGGDIASRTAVEIIAAALAAGAEDAGAEDSDTEDADAEDAGADGSDTDKGEPDLMGALVTIRAAVRAANQHLLSLNQAHGHAEGRGMGTTVVGLARVAGSERAVVFHVGDSRLYRWRGGILSPLTRDHSLYQVWFDAGAQGTPPPRNVITQALGIMTEVDPELALPRVAAGDLFLICSDGLTSMASDAEIAACLSGDPDTDTGADTDSGLTADPGLPALCRRLVALANAKGGRDNVTVVLVRAGG